MSSYSNPSNCEILHLLDRGTSVNEDVGSRRGWILRSHLGWRGEQNILYNGVETSPSKRVLTTLRTISTRGEFRLFYKYIF